MGFQILDENKNPIGNNAIDKIACEMWGLEQDPKWYAYPEVRRPDEGELDFIRRKSNWFDSLGWLIHRHNIYNFKDLIGLRVAFVIPLMEEMNGTWADVYKQLPAMKREIDFLRHLESLGYSCMQVAD